MKIAEFKRQIAQMRALGVRRFRHGDTEIELGPDETVSPLAQKEVEEQLKALMGSDAMPSADDMLFWSTGEPLPSEMSAAETVSVAAPPNVAVRKG
jgi:hypothetical protein